MKLFTKDINQKLFAQYRIGSNLNKQNVVAKIFNPYGIGRWYLLNSDPNDPEYLWAIVQMGDEVEIGSVSRSELESIRIKPFGLPLERDIYFNERNAMEVLDGLERGQTFAAGGMTAGRWYKDNSGKEFRYIGETQGKLLFNDGEKIVEKNEEDFEEDAPKKRGLFGFFEEGGETEEGVDLFEDYDDIPDNVQEILQKYDFEEGDYRTLEKAKKDVEKVGYTFEYSLDGTAYDLRKIGQKGKSEDEYAKGGEINWGQDLGDGFSIGNDVYITDSSSRFYNKNGYLVGKIGQKLVVRVGEDEMDAVVSKDKVEKLDAPMAKGGTTKRTVKLTLSDKDSYDYTYKQDGATASITFGFGKEPFQYEVKKISKSLEPLKQDILDAFTIQGIKQHEYKGGFSEAIKHLDTKVVYEDNFAKGGKVGDPISEDELKKLVERLSKKDKLDKQEFYALSKAKYNLERMKKGKMAKGGDLYDDMDEDIDFANKKARYLFNVLKNGGYNPSNLEYADYDSDASIDVTPEVHISVSLDGDIAIVKEVGDGKFSFIDCGNSAATMLQKLELHTKNKMDDGGETAAANHNIKQARYGGKLVGKQKKLDVNKNGKLDAEDFKMLRKGKMAMGGKVKFEDKVKAIKASLLKRKKVSPKVQKDYGKTYSPKEAEESAKRIVGAQTAKYELKKK